MAQLTIAVAYIKTLEQKIRDKAATEAKAVKSPWVENVGPKIWFYEAAAVEAAISFWVDVVAKMCFMW